MKYLAGLLFSLANLSIILAQNEVEISWDKITPSSTLEYSPCYNNGTFHCARLLVPLDYTDPTSPRNATLAIIKLPSELPNGDKNSQWGGPIIFNPGGPGQSGVTFLLDNAARLRPILGPNYDLVSFDPRGSGFTIPKASCYTNPAARDIVLSERMKRAASADGIASFNDVAAMHRAFSMKCAQNLKDAEHYGTVATVRDLLRLSEKSWEAAGKKEEGEKKGVQYWGQSYGTIIGVTFASMFPEKVGRFVLDGNVDPYDYSSGAIQKMSTDTDELFDKLVYFCSKSKFCPLNPSGKESAKNIKKRIDKIIEKVRKMPIPVLSPETQEEVIFTYGHLKQNLALTTYAPLQLWPLISAQLAALEQHKEGDDASSYAMPGLFARDYTQPSNPMVPEPDEATYAIGCGDADGHSWTLPEVKKEFDKMWRQSKVMTENLFLVKAGCNGWKFKAKETLRKFGAKKTKNPILFAGLTLDSATPLMNSFSNSKLFPNSSVLTIDAVGHCTLSAPSTCAWEAISNYFNTGKLPKKGLVCKPDVVPLEQNPFPEGLSKREVEEGGGVFEMVERRWGNSPI